ncbi:MAG: bifunctional hydroxymethylpyrimidine kinase/phosphomethylpyrimidine kinase [Gemmatimonadota bacterium]|nr:bifunctional hydroxymethylpyrimidine kinase/phosphomethylpyrimidine kinase [Gemmatimonadota bacterium]
MTDIPIVLAIAGSDPSGGAGIQADLKTFAALGVYGGAVLTALTAQNTLGVTGIHNVPPHFVALQIDTVFADLRVDAVKVGMISTADIAHAVARSLRRAAATHVVLDPVMIAKSGHALLDPSAIAALRDELVPLATVITPNLPEAGVLLDDDMPRTLAEMRDAVRALHGLGSTYVYLKGGHLAGDESPDLLYDGTTILELSAKRIHTANTHGTGCTLSSAIAALLPQRPDLRRAVEDAKAYLTAAIAAGDRLRVGSGRGPVHHFHAVWR